RRPADRPRTGPASATARSSRRPSPACTSPSRSTRWSRAGPTTSPRRCATTASTRWAATYRSGTASVAALTALVGTVLTFVGAYVVEKCRTGWSGVLYLLSVLPVSIPGMVLGLAYIFTFNKADSPLNVLYGTLAILIISNVIHYFTVGFLTATTALRQMDAEFENVSASLGVPFYRTFW